MSNCEIWKPVVGYEGYYEVSSEGRVRSLPRDVYAGRGRTRRHPSTMLSIYTGDRYSKVRLKVDGTGSTKNVHQLVAEAFIGARPDGTEVCHNNGDSHDNRAPNLRYDTHSSNQFDLIAHGSHVLAKRTHCNNGHEYTAENTYNEAGRRRCAQCERDRGERERKAKRDAEGRVHRRELTHCKNGHEFDAHNGRQKVCKQCARESQVRYRARKKAARKT